MALKTRPSHGILVAILFLLQATGSCADTAPSDERQSYGMPELKRADLNHALRSIGDPADLHAEIYFLVYPEQELREIPVSPYAVEYGWKCPVTTKVDIFALTNELSMLRLAKSDNFIGQFSIEVRLIRSERRVFDAVFTYAKAGDQTVLGVIDGRIGEFDSAPVLQILSIAEGRIYHPSSTEQGCKPFSSG